MKTAGLLGGMSWESTAGYYKAINEGIKQRLGGLNSAQMAMFSVNFDTIERLQHAGDWDGAAAVLVEAAQKVEAAGADFLLICTNTMHKVAEQIGQGIRIPVLHIVDATAEVLVASGVKTVGLLGTAFTMEQDFYKGRLQEKYGLEVLVPDVADRQMVHAVIYNELCVGVVNPASRAEFVRIIDALARQGAQAVILGCTEIAMLVRQADTVVPLFDTTQIHADKAVEYMIGCRCGG